ncbi:MAG: hypothetical protein ABGW69_03060 [Nanoarchaeota archaeon]
MVLLLNLTEKKHSIKKRGKIIQKAVFFITLTLIILLNKVFSDSILIPDMVIKGQSVDFWFDAYSLIKTKTDFLEESTVLKSLNAYCQVSNNKASLSLISSTFTMKKYKLLANDYGYVNITCYATAYNENNKIFSAKETKTIFITDNPEEICNSEDITINIPDYELDYLYDIVAPSYKLIKDKLKQVQIGKPIGILVDYSQVKGVIENSVLSCSIKKSKDNYNLSVLISQVYTDNKEFESLLNLYLLSVPKKYYNSFEIDCNFTAYCNFYGNKDLSKNIKTNFSIIANVKPINQTTFFILYDYMLNDVQNFTKEIQNYIKEYQIKSAEQTFEALISPYSSGLRGALIDALFNQFPLMLSMLYAYFVVKPAELSCICTAPLAPTTEVLCNPLLSTGSLCAFNLQKKIAPATTCSVGGTTITCTGVLATLSTYNGIFFGWYLSTWWIPLFFTTFFATRTIELTYLTTCDPVTKWINTITGDSVLFAVLNMFKYPPPTPNQIGSALNQVSNYVKENEKHFTEEFKEISKLFENKQFNIEQTFNDFKDYINSINPNEVNNFINDNMKLNDVYNSLQEFTASVREPFDKIRDIILAPVRTILIDLLGKKLLEKYLNPCGGTKKGDNPPDRTYELIQDYITIAGGVGSGNYGQIGQTFISSLLGNILTLIGNFVKSKEKCVLYNTLYPLTFLNKTKTAYGIDAKVNINSNNPKIDFNFFSLSNHKVYICPQEVGRALSTYSSLLASNYKCFLSSVNWLYMSKVMKNFDGDLTKLLNNDLASFLVDYSTLNPTQLKYSYLLTDYESIQNLAYCSNVRKYINCLNEEAVKSCQSNQWKVSFLFVAKTAAKVYVDYFSRIITGAIVSQILNYIDVCKSMSIIQTIKAIVQMTITFVQMKSSTEKAMSCVNKVSNINISKLDIKDLDKLKISSKCENILNDANQGASGLDCFLNPGKCSLAGWLSAIGDLLNPNALGGWINGKIDSYVNNLIDNMIKEGAKKCSINEDNEQVQIVAINTLVNQEINLNSILSNYTKNVISTSLFSIEINGSKDLIKTLQYSDCLSPTSNDIYYCEMIKLIFPYPNENDKYCIYEIKPENKEFIIHFYGNYQECNLYLSMEKSGIGTTNVERILIKNIKDCQNEIILASQDFENAYDKLNKDNEIALYFQLVPVINGKEDFDLSASSLVNPSLWQESSYYVEECNS